MLFSLSFSSSLSRAELDESGGGGRRRLNRLNRRRVIFRGPKHILQQQTRDNRWRYFFHEQRFERSCPRTVVRGGIG